MSAKVRLKDIVEALAMQIDEYASFVDRQTGKVASLSLDLLRTAEESPDNEEPDLPAWQREEWQSAQRIVSTSRYTRRPSKFQVHEWAIMEEFSLSVESDRIREDLLDAIHGKGAFRYFKDTIRRRRIEKDWHRFREDALRQIAIDWCEENEIAWE
jgi:hypothetical protein